MTVRAVLAVLLVIATVEASEGGVAFSGEKFTMTCPQAGKWYKDSKFLYESDELAYTLPYNNENKGQFYCEYDTTTPKTKYYFYVQGKVCANCYELDAIMFGAVIVVDVIMTTVVMIVIYKCSKSKSSARPPTTPQAPPRSGSRGLPAQSSDYEQLNQNTRTADPYSRLG